MRCASSSLYKATGTAALLPIYPQLRFLSTKYFPKMPSSPTRRKPRNCLWIPILLCLFNELSFAEAESSTILLPSQQNNADSVSTTFSAHCPAPDPSLNYRPVIGILSHPGDGASGRLSNATNASYIAASYVKFVESGGARVIPLIFNEPEEILFEVNEKNNFTI